MKATISTIGSGIDSSGGRVLGPHRSDHRRQAGSIHWLNPDSGDVRKTFDVGSGFIGGIALDGRGRAYACDLGEARVVRVDPGDGTVETYSRGPVNAPFVVPNYPVFDAAGRLYVSDSGGWGAGNGRVLESSSPVEPLESVRPKPRGSRTAWRSRRMAPFLMLSNFRLRSSCACRSEGRRSARTEGGRHAEGRPDGLAFVDDGRLLI